MTVAIDAAAISFLLQFPKLDLK